MTIKLISFLKETKAVAAIFNNNFGYCGDATKHLKYNLFSKSKQQKIISPQMSNYEGFYFIIKSEGFITE
jgi:hypothetical protein